MNSTDTDSYGTHLSLTWCICAPKIDIDLWKTHSPYVKEPLIHKWTHTGATFNDYPNVRAIPYSIHVVIETDTHDPGEVLAAQDKCLRLLREELSKYMDMLESHLEELEMNTSPGLLIRDNRGWLMRREDKENGR